MRSWLVKSSHINPSLIGYMHPFPFEERLDQVELPANNGAAVEEA